MDSSSEKTNKLIAETPEMKKVVNLALTAAKYESRVLIEGETGVGKEIIARFIYENSNRSNKEFISINCSAVSETLLESELFGYDKGSFTGANKEGKKGYFEIADKGVLFLDEIGEVSKNFQVKLLRALQENEIVRVGGITPIPFNVQVLVATNKDLLTQVNSGKFRSDLYYRLNVFPISIPPLRNRIADINPLAKRFISIYNEKYKTHKYLSDEAFAVLEKYDWPGNVRELENLIERLILISDSDKITGESIKSQLEKPNTNSLESIIGRPWKESIASMEKEILRKNIQKYKTISELEKVLNMSRTTLNRKIREYNLRDKLKQ